MKRVTTLLALLCAVALCVPTTSCRSNKDKKEKTTATAKRQASSPAVDSLRKRLEEFVASPRVQGKLGLYVYDLTAGAPVYVYQQNEALPCASCMKLLTGVAGMHLLGSDYKYATSIYTSGKVSNGTLHGDVTFKAGLDPQLTEADLNIFAKQIKKQGITSIDGKLVACLTITQPVTAEQHWYPWDLNFSKYGILFKGSDRILKHLKAAFRAQGITVASDQVMVGALPAGSQCLFRLWRPINPVIKRMWKNSSNTQATSLLYAIGLRANPRATAPAQAGVQYLRSFLRNEIGITDTAQVVHDGCGLCTYNKLSPRALTSILVYGYKHPSIYASLRRNLAIAGVDGTMRKMYKPALRGKVHGKTGTLSHPYGISSLAGYADASNGHTLAFCIVCTQMSVLDARVLQRRLCETLCLP